MSRLLHMGLVSVAALGLIGLWGIGSVTTAASAATTKSGMKLAGYTVEEADTPIGADSSDNNVAAFCPTGDLVVGGGAYEATQGLGQDINTSLPNGSGTQWLASFDDEGSVSNTGVAVAICAASSSLTNYSVQAGGEVTIPAGGEAQSIVTCPKGTVSLGGGANVDVTAGEDYQAMDASAPHGTNGWRTYMSSAGSEGTNGFDRVVCATKPKGWAQVNSTYKSNPANTATTVHVDCPSGTDVLGGGPFNSSADPEVTIGLTTPLTDLTAWHSAENNASSTSESVDEWAVCAKTTSASS